MKNPLTPIQLSAERLKRKYLRQIESDPETFVTCTDTIIRQVGDIGRMVDEFSSFARMPAPVIQTEDIANIVEQSVFLQRNAHHRIEFTVSVPDERPMVQCDGRLVSQALTNLLQNAVDAIVGAEAGKSAPQPKGRIEVTLTAEDQQAIVMVEDNGPGLPSEDRDRLTEPYVTTRSRGTGLGLAIVKKIMEDHGGRLLLADREGGGAQVRLVFQHIESAAVVNRTSRPKPKTKAAGT